MKLFRAQTTAPKCRETFVDWYEAADETEARHKWADDIQAHGLPKGSTVVLTECDPQTLNTVDQPQPTT